MSRLCRACGKFHDLDRHWPDECTGHFSPKEARPNSGIIRDISPYKSMITGERIRSRSHHRDHLRQHGCVEIGNETQKAPQPERPKSVKESLHRQLADVSDRQANQIIQQEIKRRHV